MAISLLKSAMKLSPAERILLVEQLWDSIADDASAPPLTASQQAELDIRLNRLKNTGPIGSDWATVKFRITGRAQK